VITPVLAMLVIATGAELYYNARVTGDPLTLPYVLDRKEYAIAPLFVWGHVRPEPAYATKSLRDVYASEAELYRKSRANLGIPELFRKGKNFWIFFVAPLLTLPAVLFLFASSPDREEDQRIQFRSVRTIWIVMLAAVAQVVWFYPHYFAPAFAPFVAGLSFGFEKLRGWRWGGQPTGIFLSRAIVVGCFLMMSIPVGAHRLDLRLSTWPIQWALGSPAEVQGPKIKSSLLGEGKPALVFVEYGEKHDPAYEWIYNEPDIQHSQIIWARRVSPESDAALIRHFQNRSIWILRPDDHPLTLIRLHPQFNK